MQATQPEQAIQLFSDRLNSGDLEGALALYAPDASFAPEPGQQVSGERAIRGALQGFFALDPTIEGEIQSVLRSDDLALVHNRWELRGREPDGEVVRMEGTSADVLRRDPDGSWRILIDNPWGG
jgi:uncharacterized protein (TIGR02246 family)